MKTVNQRAIIISLAVLIVVGGGAALLMNSDSGDKKTASSKSTQKTASTQSAITPEDVVKDFTKNSGKTISVKGKVLQVGTAGKDFYVVSAVVEPDHKTTAVKLDFSGSGLDPLQYADNPPTNIDKNYSPRGAVVVTGRLVTDQKTGSPIVLKVQSIK